MKIGPYNYKVRYEEPHTSGAVGETDSDQLTIRISPALPKQRARVILVHESLHGLFELIGTKLSQEDEEDLVDRLAPALIEFLDNNPRLLRG